MLNASKEKRSPCLKNLLKHLLELNILSTKQSDVITTEFKKFLDVEVKAMQRQLVTFSQKVDQFDDFYFKVASISKCKDLLFVVKLILTLSHGQASVEREFSLIANIMKTNMSPESFTAKRIIKDHMIANKLKPHTIEITKPIDQAFRSGRQKYEVHLQEEKKKKQKSEAELGAMHIAADIEKLRVTQKQKQESGKRKLLNT